MRFIDRVEAEFEEPFADVLQGFADMGYGCDSTAAILGYDKSSFRRLLKRKGISVRWPDASQRIDTRMSYACPNAMIAARRAMRSEEHTSELQSRPHLVCRLLLEKKKKEK